MDRGVIHNYYSWISLVDFLKQGCGRLSRFLSELPKQSEETYTMKFVDLCAGIGGLSRPLHLKGGTCVLAVEIDRWARMTYEANYGVTPWFDDITKLDPRKVPDHDVLFGGFPCQSFSKAGKQLGFDDTRGTIFFDIARIIEAKRPKYFLLENVKGLLHHASGETFRTIIETLTGLGYNVQHQLLNSVAWVPQNRRRVFILGQRDDLEPVPLPICHSTKRTVLGDILHSQDDDQISASDSKRFTDTDGTAAPKYFHSQATASWLINYKIKRALKGWTQVNFVIPSDVTGTLTASYHHDGKEITLNDGGLRKLTPRECFRLQGFPDSFVLPDAVSDTQLYRQAGNSVVPQCADLFIGGSVGIPLHHTWLGRDLRKARKALAIRQDTLANMIGLTDNTVRHIERSNGTLKSLFLMLGALNRRLPLLGKDIAELRHQRKISARKFAKQIGITRPTLVTLERHDTGRVETLLDAYGALDVTPRLLPLRDASLG
jgi:DNA (cytosine-5)-methyltransferase 1